MGQERIRYRTTETPAGPFGASDSTGWAWNQSQQSYPYYVSEHIHDIVEGFDHQGVYPWHPVTHVKVLIRPGPLPQYIKYPPIWDPFGEPVVTGYTGSYQPVALGASSFDNGDLYSDNGLVPGHVLASHSRRHLDNMLEQVPVEVSIANFLWELRNGVRELIPRVQSAIEAIPNIFLWWHFGALPFVQDLQRLLTLTSRVRARLEHLRRINGRTITANTVTVWDNPNVGQRPTFNDDWNPRFCTTNFDGGGSSVLWETVKVQTQSGVYYNLDLGGADEFLLGMCSALGLMNPAQIVWEAIPFSFAIDWFVDVQDWLEQNIDVHQPFKGTIAVKGSTHAITHRMMIETWAPTDNRGGAEVVSTTLVTAYHRRGGIPSGSVDTSGLTPLQQQLGSALIAQGLGSFYRRRRGGLT